MIKKYYFLACLFLALSSLGMAQDVRTTNTKITDLLALMPANNLTLRDQLMEQLYATGEEGFQNLSDRLVSSEKGDNSAVVFALNGLTRYVSKPGLNQQREKVEKWMISALEKSKDTEIKTFYLRQLKLIGSNPAIVEAGKFLNQDELVAPAVAVLSSVRGKEAEEILLKGLSKANDTQKLAIVNGLGELRAKGANSALLTLLPQTNTELRKVTLAALASIGAPESYSLLLDAAQKTSFGYDKVNATASFISYLDRLGKHGESKLTLDGCKELLKISDPGLSAVKAQALSLYTIYAPAEAKPILLSQFDAASLDLKVAILNLVLKSKDKDLNSWVAKAKKGDPSSRVAVVSMLGRSEDLTVAPVIRKLMTDKSDVVRKQAIASYAQLRKKEAVPDLIALMGKGIEVNSVSLALHTLLDSKSLEPLSALLKNSNQAVKLETVRLIGDKSGKNYFDQIYGMAQNGSPELKQVALGALVNLSDGSQIGRLIDLLESFKDQSSIKLIQNAIVRAATDLPAAEQADRIIERINKSQDKSILIPVLPRIGGTKGLACVGQLLKSNNEGDKKAASLALINWPGSEATGLLYQLCKSLKGEELSTALKGLVRQVVRGNLPDDQKLLYLRNGYELSLTTPDRLMIIEAMGQVRTFLSLVTLSGFLNDETLKEKAAQSVMSVALPAEGKGGMTGQVVRKSLENAIPALRGSESEYDKARIRKYLNEMSLEDGFVSMFNGKNLDGWQGLVGNPISRAKMDPKLLEQKQQEANKKVTNNWSVKDGAIVFNGAGDNLCSVRKYGDFEMVVDWKITKKGDSGIYLRGSPQVQIWDTSRVEVGAQVGSGGLYNNQKNPSKPSKVADNPVGEWNTFRIKMIGEKVSVWLNGENVVNEVTLENYWDRSLPIFPKEAIELQAHGTDLAFRDIYVKELNNTAYQVSEEESKEGFKPLFNGLNLDGWVGNKVNYRAENGEIALHMDDGPSHGNLYTADEYSDFVYRMEFQLTPAANNGLGIRAPLEGDAAYVGMELQILDNEDPVYATLMPYQYHGSVYGVIPAKRGFLKPVGEWNYEEVVAKGSHIKITLNGTVILDGDIKEASKNGTIDHKQHPGLLREKGHIGFLGHGSVVKFRNIRIKDLSTKTGKR